MSLHLRSELHVTCQREHRDDLHAYLCHGPVVLYPPRAIDVDEGRGVLIGCVGAVSLILSSAHSGGKTGNIWGDLMCMGAQLSFALYLTLYNPLIRRYHVVTVNKWMFTWSCVFILPFSSSHVALLPVDAIAAKTWAEVFYVVVFGTFLSYLLAVVGQRILRPTVVSVYNYVQPVVSVLVSVLTGLSIHRSTRHRRHLHLLRRLARDQVEVEERPATRRSWTQSMRGSLAEPRRLRL